MQKKLCFGIFIQIWIPILIFDFLVDIILKLCLEFDFSGSSQHSSGIHFWKEQKVETNNRSLRN